MHLLYERIREGKGPGIRVRYCCFYFTFRLTRVVILALASHDRVPHATVRHDDDADDGETIGPLYINHFDEANHARFFRERRERKSSHASCKSAQNRLRFHCRELFTWKNSF